MPVSTAPPAAHVREAAHQDGGWPVGAVPYAENAGGPSRYLGPESSSSAQARELHGRSRLVYMGARPTLPRQARPDEAQDPAGSWTGRESSEASGGAARLSAQLVDPMHHTSNAGMDPMYDLLQQLRATQYGVSGPPDNAPPAGQTPEVIRKSRKSRGEQMPDGSPGAPPPKERTLVGERLAALRSRREELKGALLGILTFPAAPEQPSLGAAAGQPGRSSPPAVRRCLQLSNGDVTSHEGEGASQGQGLARASREDMPGRGAGAADSSLLGELLQRLLHPSDAPDVEGGVPVAHGHAGAFSGDGTVGDGGMMRSPQRLFADGRGGVRSVLGRVLNSGGLLRPGDLLEGGRVSGHSAGVGASLSPVRAGQEWEEASGHWEGLRGCIESLRVAMAKLDGAQGIDGDGEGGGDRGGGDRGGGSRGRVATVSVRGSLELSGILDASARSWSLQSSGGVPSGAVALPQSG